MKKLDLKLLLKYTNKWIATRDDDKSILASDEDIGEVEQKLKKQKIKRATLTFLTPPDKYISPLCQF